MFSQHSSKRCCSSLTGSNQSTFFLGRTAMQMDMREEQLLAVQFDAVRDAHIEGAAALARGTDRLQHRIRPYRGETESPRRFEPRSSQDQRGPVLIPTRVVLA